MDVCSSISQTMCDSERCYSRKPETFNLGGDCRASLGFAASSGLLKCEITSQQLRS